MFVWFMLCRSKNTQCQDLRMRICLALVLVSLQDLQVYSQIVDILWLNQYYNSGKQPFLLHHQHEIANVGRKRSRRTMQPRDTKELEVDVTDAMYSSSQQINGQQKPGML